MDRIGPCFEGRHTSDPSVVTYNDRYSNVTQCKLDVNGKCTVEERYWDEEDPQLLVAVNASRRNVVGVIRKVR